MSARDRLHIVRRRRRADDSTTRLQVQNQARNQARSQYARQVDSTQPPGSTTRSWAQALVSTWAPSPYIVVPLLRHAMLRRPFPATPVPAALPSLVGVAPHLFLGVATCFGRLRRRWAGRYPCPLASGWVDSATWLARSARHSALRRLHGLYLRLVLSPVGRLVASRPHTTMPNKEKKDEDKG